MTAHGEKIYKTGAGRIISDPFMVLDKKSKDDRKVILIHQSLRNLYNQEEGYENWYEGVDNIIWSNHCIPFEKAAFFWLLLTVKPGTKEMSSCRAPVRKLLMDCEYGFRAGEAAT